MVQTSTFLKKKKDLFLLFIVSGTRASPPVHTPLTPDTGFQERDCPALVPERRGPFPRTSPEGTFSVGWTHPSSLDCITQHGEERVPVTFPSSSTGPFAARASSVGMGVPCPTLSPTTAPCPGQNYCQRRLGPMILGHEGHEVDGREGSAGWNLVVPSHCPDASFISKSAAQLPPLPSGSSCQIRCPPPLLKM